MRLLLVLGIALASLVAGACSKGDSHALRVGIEAKYPPFESLNAAGEFEGFDIELARELGRHLGRPVEFHDMDWDSLIPSVQADRIDLICSGMSWTEERTKLIDFTKPYAQSPMSVLVNTQMTQSLKSAADLNDAAITIAVQRGTTGATKAKATFGRATFKEFGTENEAATEVGTGRCHAFVYDYLSVAKYAKQYERTTRVLPDSLGTEDYCMAVKLGSPLRGEVDAFVAEAKKPGGAIPRLMDEWLPGATEKMTPK